MFVSFSNCGMLVIPFWELTYDMFDSFHHPLKSAFKRDVSDSFSLEGSEISADLNVKFLLVGFLRSPLFGSRLLAGCRAGTYGSYEA